MPPEACSSTPMFASADRWLHASAEGGLGALHRFAVEARVDGAVVAEGQIVLAIQGRNAAAQE